VALVDLAMNTSRTGAETAASRENSNRRTSFALGLRPRSDSKPLRSRVANEAHVRGRFLPAPNEREHRHPDHDQHQHHEEPWSCHRAHLSLIAVTGSAGERRAKVHDCRMGYASRADSNAVARCVLALRDSMELPQDPQTRGSVCGLVPDFS
jgi:hypothetical protein